jgi:hypothetical protein
MTREYQEVSPVDEVRNFGISYISMNAQPIDETLNLIPIKNIE